MTDKLDDFLLSGVPATNAEIAGQFGVHVRTVRKRRKRLRDKGLLGTKTDELTITGSDTELSFTGLQSTNPLDPSQDGAFAKIFELAGLNQDEFELVKDSFKFSTWQQSKATDSGERDFVQLYSYRGTFKKKSNTADLAKRLTAKITAVPPALTKGKAKGLPLIVNLADLQISKRDLLGGLDELVERFESIIAQIVAVAQEDLPREIIIADVGDICENTSNNTGTSQVSTNDVPLSTQMEWANRLVTQAIISLLPYTERMTVLGVPSNHGAERLPDGKQNQDGDWGITNILTLKNAFAMLSPEAPVEFKVPEKYQMSVGHEVESCKIVWTHGHLVNSPDRMPQWLANQAATPGTIYAECSALFFGHFHHLYMTSSRGRDIYGCPTLDSGSSWYTNKTGEWSRPGILTARVAGGRVCRVQVFESKEI